MKLSRQSYPVVVLLAAGLSAAAAYAQITRTESAAPRQVFREKITITSQSDCDFSRECAEAQVKLTIPQALAKQCYAVGGPRAEIERVETSRGSCANMGKGREGRSSYRCTVHAQAVCAIPGEDKLALMAAQKAQRAQ